MSKKCNFPGPNFSFENCPEYEAISTDFKNRSGVDLTSMSTGSAKMSQKAPIGWAVKEQTCDHITRAIEIKTHAEEGVFSGYASVFSVVDHHGDTVMPGAFTKTLQKMLQTRVYPKMLWHHDTRFPIGVWTKIEEDAHGLKVTGKLLLDIQQGKETYALMKAGVLDGLSIGFRPIKARKKTGGRLLDEVDLYEISLVTFASNPEARVVDLKSEDMPDHNNVDDLIRRLDRLGDMLRV